MAKALFPCSVLMALLFAGIAPARATTPDEASAAATRSTQSESKDAESPVEREQRDRPVYTPPRRGAPITRVGGGTRSASSRSIQVALLSPPHTGLTTRPSPVLYWYVSEDFDGLTEFVVTATDAVVPLLKLQVEGPVAAGIHPLDLQAQRVELETNRVYQWSVAIVRDPERRSHDVVSIATIERVERDAAPAAAVADDVSALAGAGLWYDAMEALHRALREVSPTDDLRTTRADLLDQAELPAVAAWDRAQSCARASC